MPDQAVENIAALLAASYLNKAGVISCQFVIKLKQQTPEIIAATNTKLVEMGYPAYDIDAKKSRNRNKTRAQPAGHPIALSGEDAEKERQIIAMLEEIQRDKNAAQSWLDTVIGAENHYQQKLHELRGTKFTPKPDPYVEIYAPAHDHARNNRAELAASSKCGCFFCRAIFDPKIIAEFADNGQTAICPNCGVDSLIGDKAGYELNNEFLIAMFRRWFAVPIRIRKIRELNPMAIAPPTVPPAIAPPIPPAPPAPEPEPEPELPEIDDEKLAGLGSKLIANLPADDEEDM